MNSGRCIRDGMSSGFCLAGKCQIEQMKKFILNLDDKGAAGLALVAIFLLIAALELGAHWLMLQNYSWFQIVLAFHAYSGGRGKGDPGTIDIVLPAVSLGIFTGLFGWKWSGKRLCLAVARNAIGLAALLPIYKIILGQHMWWCPADGEAIKFAISYVLPLFLLTGAFTLGGMRIGEDWAKDTGAFLER
jgi:hypothetical protein